MDRPLTDDERVTLHASDTFAERFAGAAEPVPQRAQESDDDAWVALHNAGRVNLLERCRSALDGLDWDVAYPFGQRMARVLPALQSSAMAMADFLVAVEDTHLGMGLVAPAVTAWLRANADVCQAVTRAPAERHLQARLFTLALQARGTPQVARDWLGDEAKEVRVQALDALSNMTDDAAGVRATVAILPSLLAEASDEERLLLIKVVIHLTDLMENVDIADVVTAILNGGDAACLRQASLGLRISPAFMTSNAREPVVDALGALGADASSGDVTEVVRKLASAGHVDSAVRLCEMVGTNAIVAVLLDTLDADTRCDVVLGWLRRDDLRVLPGMAHFFTMRAMGGADDFCVPSSSVAPMADRRLFVGMKAVAWMLHAPQSAMAVLLALLDGAEEVARAPLLTLVRDLLRDDQGLRVPVQAAADVRGDERLRELVREHDAHMHTLDGMAPLPELRPPPSHRAVMVMLNQRDMQASSRAAEAESAFLSFVTRIEVLHGAGTLGSVYAPDGAAHFSKNMMATIKRGYLLPSTSVLDPVGYEMRLVTFRLAGVE
ncbi:hypothetical protein FHW69_001354 [Luteibacter sp. Sphag1AF]|uniref:hypothetical protein n=1 Tax=Luteibacter sp. Sphag1AF TaxID=2587031 RepID=UPI00160E66E1|nr:hypothetical protein [Luteibacter sp. Sphag1AF]MBB3226764.1 hypothetical protein [Luteibacter sp. Sphag1AF]